MIPNPHHNWKTVLIATLTLRHLYDWWLIPGIVSGL